MGSFTKKSTPTHRVRRPIEVLGSRGRDIDQVMFCEECHLQIRPSSEITAVRTDAGSPHAGLKVIHLGCANGYEPLGDAELEEVFDRLFGKRTAMEGGTGDRADS